MDRIGRATQFAGNYLRFGWYSGIGWLAAREGRRIAPPASVTRQRPVPSEQEMLADLAHLFRKDAALVGDGLAAASASDPAGGLSDHFQRLGAMMRDVPDAVRRRQDRDAGTVAPLAEEEGVPDYFAQDFHFQKGGYLADDSARLYDVQVETLFYGSAAAMRRAALRPIGEHLARRDQRGVHLLDVACGTGRLLREIRLVYPALSLTGLDLSPAYLAEARRHMGNLRPVTLVKANAETMPLADASQDIVTSLFLFHELPADVRRRVASEMARVLKPGGVLVFIDSLQIGDRPGWDGLLEGFPQRFHEPYYRHYTIDDLDAVFNGVGLQAVGWSPAFLSKVMVRRKG